MTNTNLDVDVTARVTELPITPSAIRLITQKILKILRWENVSLSILLVGEKRISSLNKEYLHHDWVTDVIAFPQQKKATPGKKKTFLGDLAICVPTAKRQSKEFVSTFIYELCFYICHGILHLMGYDDKTKTGAAWMNRKQKEVLKKIGVK